MTLLRANPLAGQKREDTLFRKFTFEATLVSKRRRRTVKRDGQISSVNNRQCALKNSSSQKLRHRLLTFRPASATKSTFRNDMPLNTHHQLTCSRAPDNGNSNAAQLWEQGVEPRNTPFSAALSNSPGIALDSVPFGAVSQTIGKENNLSDKCHNSSTASKTPITNMVRLTTAKSSGDDRARRPPSGRTSSGRQKVPNCGKPSFSSVEQGITQGRLFHTVSQTPLRAEAVEMEDSDVEDDEEREWRFRLRRDEIVEYVDTLPVESLFMNLWNQFVGMEFCLDSDRSMASACDSFVKSMYVNFCRLLSLESCN